MSEVPTRWDEVEIESAGFECGCRIRVNGVLLPDNVKAAVHASEGGISAVTIRFLPRKVVWSRVQNPGEVPSDE